MPNLDRAGMVELLGRLGAENDATVLAAARELHRKVGESGLTWDDLLRASTEAASAASSTAHGDDPPGDRPADVSDGKADAARLIERLLARQTVSDTLREDLTDLKRAIARGTFDDTDARYVRALAKRLGV